MWRCEQEKRNFLQLQGLILPMSAHDFSRKRPESWPDRQNIRCPICISMQLATPRDERGPRSKKGTNIQIWNYTASQRYSLTEHVICCHTDLGSKRYCGVCGKCCESSKGFYQHFLLKQCGYDTESANACSKMLEISDRAQSNWLRLVGLALWVFYGWCVSSG